VARDGTFEALGDALSNPQLNAFFRDGGALDA
jgi:hypothetical protein